MTDLIRELADIDVVMHETSGWTNLRPVILCDENGALIASDAVEPRSVNWRTLPGQERSKGTAVLPGNSEIKYEENSAYVSNPPQVYVGCPPKSATLTVYGYNSLAGRVQQGNLSMDDQKFISIGNPHVYSLVDFRVRPTDTTSSSVYVEAGVYERLSAPGTKRRFAGGTLDLSAPIAALPSGYHQGGTVYMDRETEALGIVLSAPATAASSVPSRSELDATGVRLRSRQKACGTVYLYYGQATPTIVQADVLSLYDPRLAGNEQPGLTSAVCYNGKMIVRGNKVIFI